MSDTDSTTTGSTTPETSTTNPTVETTSTVTETTPTVETPASSPKEPVAATETSSADTAVATPVSTPSEGVAAVTPESTVAAQLARRQMLTQYGIALLIVLIMGAGLWYVLEQQGRVETKVFESMKSFVMPAPAAVVVNGTRIDQELYDKNYSQLSAQAAQQGLDPATPEVAAQIKQQSIDIIVNSELLRQAAVAGGVVVTQEQIDNRYEEIVAAQGSLDQLKTRMSELGITEESLMADIENEILIQTHLASAVDSSSITVTDEEVQALYDSIASNEAVDVPPLAEVRAQVEQEIRFGKEQELISEYIETLKKDAAVEVLI